VEQVEFLDLSSRYNSLSVSGWHGATLTERSNCLARFETVMQRCYGKPLREQPTITDLIALLTEPKPSQPHHIHYPRTDLRPDPDGKNFEWFVANKAKSKKLQDAGPNLSLETPGTEKGLPLLQKVEKK
jgi:hypothetical protein